MTALRVRLWFWQLITRLTYFSQVFFYKIKNLWPSLCFHPPPPPPSANFWQVPYCKLRYSCNWDGKTLEYDKCDRAITCEFCHNLHLTILRSCLLQKDLSLKRKVKFGRYFSWGINIVTLVTQGLPSSFFCRSSLVCCWTGGVLGIYILFQCF